VHRFSVSATGHSLNYLPEYIANWRGFFAEEGLEVSVTVPKPWDLVLKELADGDADVVLGGIWVPSMYLGREQRYTPFAQVAARAPLALLGRETSEEFSWESLVGKVVLMKGSNGASVGVYFKMLLREHGIDPRSVDFVQDLDGAMLSTLFAGGMGDYLLIDYLSAAKAAESSAAHVVSAMISTGGDIPWSVYYAEGESTPDRLATQTAFVRALGRGMDWVLATDPEEYREFLATTFPAVPVDVTIRLTNEFRANGMWTTPRIDQAAYDRWQRGIADAFLTAAPIAYDDLIDRAPTAE
jgi:NitT/TauT family transport system substrate-binding protein